MKAKSSAYVPEIDFLKFGLAVIVAVYHLLGSIFPHGHLVNEFFFIVSGYFMARNIASHAPSLSTVHFLWKKFSPIYPVLFVSTAIAFAATMFFNKTSTIGCVSALVNSFWEFAMLREAVLPIGPGYNAPAWFLSSMLFAMIVLHPAIQRLRETDLVPIVSFVIAAISYGMLWNECGGIVAGDRRCWLCSYRIIRALGGISVGILLHGAVTAAKVRLKFTFLDRFPSFVLALLLACSAALLLCPRRVALPLGTDFLAIPMFFTILFLLFSGLATFNWKYDVVSRALGSASLYIYLNHYVVVRIMRHYHSLSWMENLIAFIVGTAISCLVCLLLVRLLEKLVRHIYSRLFEVANEIAPVC